MSQILAAALLWIVTHLGISSSPVRAVLVQRIGAGPYLLLYSIVAAATLGLLIYVFISVPRFEYWWMPNPDLYWVAKLTMPIACILLVGGFLVQNPSNVGQDQATAKLEDPSQTALMATGVTRITRHPVQWAITIWAAGHVIANGDIVSVIFFSSIFVVSFFGAMLMDRKKAGSMGDHWQAYTGVTSNVPFMALFTGRNRLVWSELWIPIVAGLLLYLAMYYFHETLSGAPIV